MNFQIIFVLLTLSAMVMALIYDRMRPGLVLFSAVVVLLIGGILSPEEVVMGFSNKGMITVALLFLVSEGVRQSGALSQLIKKILPQRKSSVIKAQLSLLPSIAFISSLLNNTPVVVIFAPIIKRWAEKNGLSATKFLIPLSFATILGGMCTLIGTSTNLVVHGMMLNAGFRGFEMFELGKVGVFIAIAGILYLFLFSKILLPDSRLEPEKDDNEETADNKHHTVEAVIATRFPGINKKVKNFDFERHFGASLKSIKRNGIKIEGNLEEVEYHENDTLILRTDQTFLATWGDSSFFVLLSDASDEPTPSKKQKWLAIVLLVSMISGATIGELPIIRETFPNIKLDMFFFVSVTTVIMAWAKLFPPKKYTKFISWDILITIACAFAISKSMQNSGFADLLAKEIIALTERLGPHALLAIVFIITNLFTELITNNAAAALSFPIAMSVATQMGVDPMPFFVTICMSASSSFSTPIGYQTNLIVQGIGNYKFSDFVRIGLPLNIIAFILSVILIPIFWPF